MTPYGSEKGQAVSFSDYVIYVDESGDHGLTTVDPNYPCFVLSFCIFEKTVYADTVLPLFQKFKYKYWGHDAAILHTIDIKREKGDFQFLQHLPTKQVFMDDLAILLEQAPFTLVASIIDKAELKQKYKEPHNPYDIALRFCMERALAFLKDKGQGANVTTIIVEERGTREDRDLELTFRRICDGDSVHGKTDCFDIRFCSKKANLPGLQIADLVSTPIGRKYLNPDQPNRAYDIIDRKLRASLRGEVEGYGRKVFP